MFHSKTEAFEDKENDCHQVFYDQPTIVNFQTTELALERAIQNITELQQNLSFMIDLNDQLRAQNQRLKANQQKITMQTNSQISKREHQMQMMREENYHIADLLEEAKKSLIGTEQELVDCQQEIARKERIIREQKKAYEELENNFMNQSVSCLNIGENSSFCGKADFQYISELEKENTQLHIAIKKLEQQNEKHEAKSMRYEKEVGEYKKWMASLLGMQKIVEGSQKIIMNEISQRIISA